MFGAYAEGKCFFKLFDFRAGRKPIGAKNLDHRLDIVFAKRLPAIGQQSFAEAALSPNRANGCLAARIVAIHVPQFDVADVSATGAPLPICMSSCSRVEVRKSVLLSLA